MFSMTIPAGKGGVGARGRGKAPASGPTRARATHSPAAVLNARVAHLRDRFAGIEERYAEEANKAKKEELYKFLFSVLTPQLMEPSDEAVVQQLKEVCLSLRASYEDLLEVLATFVVRLGEPGSDQIPAIDAENRPLPKQLAPYWRERESVEPGPQQRSFFAISLMLEEGLCGSLITTKMSKFVNVLLPSLRPNSNANPFHVQKVFDRLMVLGDQQAMRHYCYQPKVMQQLLKLLHYSPVADFIITLLTLNNTKFELPEKMSLWTHLSIGQFFPSIGHMMFEQANECIAAHAADFFSRIVTEMSANVSESHLLLEQVLEGDFLSSLLKAAANAEGKFSPVQAEETARALMVLVDHTVPPSTRGDKSPPEYLRPLGDKMNECIRGRLPLITKAYSPHASGAREGDAEEEVVRSISALDSITFGDDADSPGGSNEHADENGTSESSKPAPSKPTAGAEEGTVVKMEGSHVVLLDLLLVLLQRPSSPATPILEQLIADRVWDCLTQWACSIRCNPFFHKTFYQVLRLVIQLNHGPTMTELLFKLRFLERLVDVYLSSPSSTSRTFTRLYLNLFRLAGDTQHWTCSVSNSISGEMILRDYLLQSSSWWDFLPRLRADTQEQCQAGVTAFNPRPPPPRSTSFGGFPTSDARRGKADQVIPTTPIFSPTPQHELDLPTKFQQGIDLGSSFACMLGFPCPPDGADTRLRKQ